MIRLQAEINGRCIKHWHLHDALSAIHMPSGRRHTIGRHAERKLIELAQNTIEKNDDLIGKVDAHDLVNELKIELASEQICQTDRAAADIVAECASRLASRLSNSVKFFIPCRLPRHSLVTRFRIGPIQFHLKEKVWGEIKDQLKSREQGWFRSTSQKLSVAIGLQ